MVEKLKAVYDDEVECGQWHTLPTTEGTIESLITGAISNAVSDALNPTPPGEGAAWDRQNVCKVKLSEGT